MLRISDKDGILTHKRCGESRSLWEGIGEEAGRETHPNASGKFAFPRSFGLRWSPLRMARNKKGRPALQDRPELAKSDVATGV